MVKHWGQKSVETWSVRKLREIGYQLKLGTKRYPKDQNTRNYQNHSIPEWWDQNMKWVMIEMTMIPQEADYFHQNSPDFLMRKNCLQESMSSIAIMNTAISDEELFAWFNVSRCWWWCWWGKEVIIAMLPPGNWLLASGEVVTSKWVEWTTSEGFLTCGWFINTALHPCYIGLMSCVLQHIRIFSWA